jgi:hypothetical protein
VLRDVGSARRHPQAPPRLRPDETITVKVLPGPVALTDAQLEAMAEEYLEFILETEEPNIPDLDVGPQ